MAALMVGAAALPNTARAGISFGGAYRDENIAVDVSYFYDELAPYGSWVDYGSYGWCWVPGEVASAWRPYSNGHWIYTDYGWTWASYEPWGWATYHYGRWVFDPMYGWVWVPGTTWAPAWVAWREGDDCIGWAPLPPAAGWSVSVGLTFGDSYYNDIPYQGWCFVPETRFLDTDLRARLVSWDRNRELYSRSRDYTRFASRDGWPVNQGIPLNQVERTMGRNVPRLRVTDLQTPGRGHGVLSGRDAVGFFRPRVRSGEPRVAPREDARLTVRGRGRDGMFGRGFETRDNRGGPGLFERRSRDDNDRGAVRDRGPDRPDFGRQREQRDVQRPDFGRQREEQQRMEDRLRERGFTREPRRENAAPDRQWGAQPDRPVDRDGRRDEQSRQERPQLENRDTRRVEWQRAPERQQQQPSRGQGRGRDRKQEDRGDKDGGGDDRGHRGNGHGKR